MWIKKYHSTLTSAKVYDFFLVFGVAQFSSDAVQGDDDGDHEAGDANRGNRRQEVGASGPVLGKHLHGHSPRNFHGHSPRSPGHEGRVGGREVHDQSFKRIFFTHSVSEIMAFENHWVVFWAFGAG